MILLDDKQLVRALVDIANVPQLLGEVILLFERLRGISWRVRNFRR